MLRKFADELSRQLVVVGEECEPAPPPPPVPSPPVRPNVPRPPSNDGGADQPSTGPINVFTDLNSSTWQDGYGRCWYGVRIFKTDGTVVTPSKTLIPC